MDNKTMTKNAVVMAKEKNDTSITSENTTIQCSRNKLHKNSLDFC